MPKDELKKKRKKTEKLNNKNKQTGNNRIADVNKLKINAIDPGPNNFTCIHTYIPYIAYTKQKLRI